MKKLLWLFFSTYLTVFLCTFKTIAGQEVVHESTARPVYTITIVYPLISMIRGSNNITRFVMGGNKSLFESMDDGSVFLIEEIRSGSYYSHTRRNLRVTHGFVKLGIESEVPIAMRREKNGTLRFYYTVNI